MFSIIIPVGPTCDVPWPLINQLSKEKASVIVSSTNPEPLEHRYSVTWVHSAKGRATQINEAIKQSACDWFWVLHADSQVPQGAVKITEAFCELGRWREIGYCQLRFDKDGPPWVKLNAWGANLRTTLFQQPYGDQGLCIHRQMWHALGGFNIHLDRGEDLDFIIRSRLMKSQLTPLPMTITTSARRYRDEGWLHTTIAHQKKAWALIREAKRWRP